MHFHRSSRRTFFLFLLCIGVLLMVAVGTVIRLREDGGPSTGATAKTEVEAGRTLKLQKTRQVNETTWIVSKEERDRYLDDLPTANRHINLKPVFASGSSTIQSLLIIRLEPESPAYVAGFRVNDRVLSVNGLAVDTMGRAINLSKEIKSSDHLRVQVQRKDRIIDYQFDFE